MKELLQFLLGIVLMIAGGVMDSAMIQQQIPEQVLKNSNRELL